MSVRYHSSKAHNAPTLVYNPPRLAIAFLKRSNRGKNKLQQLKSAASSILKLLSTQRLGVGLQFSGRIHGAKKASSSKISIGSVPPNTLDALIDHSGIMQKTRNGTRGFKVWLRHDSDNVGCFDMGPSILTANKGNRTRQGNYSNRNITESKKHQVRIPPRKTRELSKDSLCFQNRQKKLVEVLRP